MAKYNKSNMRTKKDDLYTFAKELLILVSVSSLFSIILISGIARNI